MEEWGIETMSVYDLPSLNALLNLSSAILLLAGYRAIRRGRRLVHKRFMLSALAASALFLTSYLIYHSQAGSKAFGGEGLVRIVYFIVLITHTILAIAIVPLICITLFWILKGDYEKHKAFARRTFPLWLYVSVTGVVIYLMLYQL